MAQVLIVDCKRTNFIFVAILVQEGCHVSIKSSTYSDSNFVLNLRAATPVCNFVGWKRLNFPIGGGRVEDSFFREVWKQCLFHMHEISSDETYQDLLRKCLSQIRLVLRHCYNSVLKEHFHLVRRYPPTVRLFLYNQIQHGVGSEVLQLLLLHNSGVSLFLLFTGTAGYRESYRELTVGIRRSDRIKPLFEKVIKLYLSERFGGDEVDDWGFGSWILRDANLKEKVKQKYKIIIERAQSYVDPAWLEFPPLFSVIPEDIPKDKWANKRWYQVYWHFSCWAFSFILRQKKDLDILRGIWAFALRNSDFVHRRINLEGDLFFSDLFERCKQRGIVLQRNSGLSVLGDGDDLLDLLTWLKRDYECDWESAGFGYPDVRLPTVHSYYRKGELEIQPIISIRHLFEEGKRMRHCVGSLWDRALFGSGCYYSVLFRGQRLTLEILKDEDGVRISQLFGIENRESTPEEFEAVKNWFDSVKMFNWQLSKWKRGGDRIEGNALIDCVYDKFGPYYPISNVRRVNVLV